MHTVGHALRQAHTEALVHTAWVNVLRWCLEEGTTSPTQLYSVIRELRKEMKNIISEDISLPSFIKTAIAECTVWEQKLKPRFSSFS